MSNKTIIMITAMLILTSVFLTVGAINMSELWTLLDEVVDNADTIINLVILGVMISIAIYLGTFVRNLLKKATGGK